jgi:hypothetical protein
MRRTTAAAVFLHIWTWRNLDWRSQAERVKAGEIKRRAIVIGDAGTIVAIRTIGSSARARARDHISPLGTIIQHSGSQVLPIT